MGKNNKFNNIYHEGVSKVSPTMYLDSEENFLVIF